MVEKVDDHVYREKMDSDPTELLERIESGEHDNGDDLPQPVHDSNTPQVPQRQPGCDQVEPDNHTPLQRPMVCEPKKLFVIKDDEADKATL